MDHAVHAAVLAVLATAQHMPATPPGGSAPASEPSNITARMRAEDPRLATRLTLAIRRQRLGEVIEAISRQTGVALSVGELDGSADVPVAAHCTDLALAEVLDDIWAVMSHKHGDWEWKRSGVPGEYCYRLTQPQEAQAFAQRMRRWVQATYEADAAKLIAASGGSDKVRKATVDALYGKQGALAGAMTDDELWGYVRVFAEGLTLEQRRRALTGEEFRISVDVLSAPTRDFLAATLHRHVQGYDWDSAGHTTPSKPPRELVYSPHTARGVPRLDAVGNGMVSGLICGGWPLAARFYDMMTNSWMQTDDQADDPAALRIVDRRAERPEDRPGREEDRRIRRSTPPSGAAVVATPLGDGELHTVGFDRQLEQVATGAGVPVFARLPEDPENWNPELQFGKPIKDCWHLIWCPGAAIKWRGGALLLTDLSWPLMGRPVPLSLVRKLRKDVEESGALPLTDLVTVAGTLTPGQIARLAGEFPVMRAVARAQGVLALFHRYPDMARQTQLPGGLPLTPPVVSALQSLPASPINEAMRSGAARFLAIRVRDAAPGNSTPRRIEMIVLGADGKTITGLGFVDVGKATDKPADAARN